MEPFWSAYWIGCKLAFSPIISTIISQFITLSRDIHCMTNNFSEKANFIWQVVDDILRGAFKAHEYGDVRFCPSSCCAGSTLKPLIIALPQWTICFCKLKRV